MPKSNLAPSQNWDVNNHIEQSKEINAQRNKEVEDYSKKTEAIKRINSALDNYESLGLDVKPYREKLATKTKEMELSFGEKLGVIGRNIANDYTSSVSKAIGAKPVETYQNRLDNIKQEREEEFNPISTMATEVALDPLTYTPLSFATKGTKAVRAAKDFGKGAALSSSLYTAKEYGDDDFKASDALLAGAFGGTLNAGIGRFVNRKIDGDLANGDVTSHENIMQKGAQEGKRITVPKGEEVKKQTAETAEPIADEMFQEQVIDDDEIAKKILSQNDINLPSMPEQEADVLFQPKTKNVLPESLPLNDREEMEEIIKYAIKNNVEDEFLSKLPSNVNKEKALEFLSSLKTKEPNFSLVGEPKTIYPKHSNPNFQEVKIDDNISANLNMLSNKRIKKLDENIKYYDTPEKMQYLINKALGKPTHKIRDVNSGYNMITNAEHKNNPTVFIDDKNNVKKWAKSAYSLRNEQLLNKMKEANSGSVAMQTATSAPVSRNNIIISKEIPKSQDIKLNASSTISGGVVGGVVGATNDLDNDGKITAKDIAIGALGGAVGTKGLILAKETNAVSKATKKLKDIADTDFVNSFSGHKIYEKKSYMKNREAMIGSKNKKMEDFAELHEQLDLLSTDTKKDLHKYMSGENVKLSDSLRKLADNYTLQIEKQGQELVDLGILDKAQYEKFKGRYLHRVYEKDLLKDFSQTFKKGKTITGVHTRGREWTGTKTEYEKYLKEGKLGDFFGGKIEARKLKNGQYKFIQDWTPEQRTKWGEVEDIAYTLPETLMRMNEMLEHGKFLQKVSKDMNIVSDEALDGYTQLRGERFGALKDKYVPKDVADDITEFNRVMFGEEDGAIFSKEVKEAYQALSTFWKKSHTVYNPVAHVNNLMSNVTMQFMEGINPVKALNNAKRGAIAHGKLGEFRKLTAKKIIGLTDEESKKLNLLANDEDLQLYIKANDAGLFGRSRLNDILNQYVGPTKKSKVPGTLKKLDEVASNYYQGEDNIMRFSMLKSMIDKGESFEEAISHVNRTIPDYTKPMSQMARFGRKSMLTPFISWTYYSTPIILRQFKEHHGRAAAILGALYGINKAMGIDPYDKKDIPQQNFSIKRIPIYRNGNEVTTIKVDRWMPHNEILSPHDFVKNLYNGGAWKGGYEVLNNQNLYYGRKITYNKGARKAYDISKYAVQQITPDIIDKAWNFTESAILDKKTRTKNPVIQPRSTVQELLNAAGINTLTYNKSNQARKARSEELKK